MSNNPDQPVQLDWKVSLLRLTAFPSPLAEFDKQNWWSEITGEPPEMQRNQPKEGTIDEIGKYKDGLLILQVQPIRIDWQYRADEISVIPQFPSAGLLDDTIEVFLDLMNRWFQLDGCPNVVRLAFGAILIQPVDDRQKGYNLLAQYLPFDPDLEGASDFQYHINRRRDSKLDIPNLSINRLHKWIVVERTTQIIDPRRSSRSTLPHAFALQLELDINTIPDYDGEFSRAQLPSLFAELVELGQEIALRGDIR